MNKQVNTITKANGSKDTNEVTKYSAEDESTILTLERAKGLAEYISKNNAFAAQFGEKDENGNSINLFFGSFKTYGGTEKTVNGVYSIEDTANIETMYRSDITGVCRIARAEDKAVFDIINEPEDINQRHQFLKFKVKRLKGGA